MQSILTKTGLLATLLLNKVIDVFAKNTRNLLIISHTPCFTLITRLTKRFYTNLLRILMPDAKVSANVLLWIEWRHARFKRPPVANNNKYPHSQEYKS